MALVAVQPLFSKKAFPNQLPLLMQEDNRLISFYMAARRSTIAFLYFALHCIAHFIALLCISLHCFAFLCIALLFFALLCIALRCGMLGHPRTELAVTLCMLHCAASYRTEESWSGNLGAEKKLTRADMFCKHHSWGTCVKWLYEKFQIE